MLLHIRRSILASLAFLVLCGLAYPLVETGIAHAAFPYQANGSLRPNGSTLIGQRFSGPDWFHGRPGAYNPMASGPTNLGPRSAVLERHVAARIAQWRRLGVRPTSGLVTSSGSGLDPDISPRSAYAQVGMVARARKIPPVALRRLVASEVHGRQLGFLGSPYVNVLQLNEAVARLVSSHAYSRS
ncbi:MAG: potassium-transporting ATPase subunit C [Acidimicrobiales bacterium]